MGDQAGNTIISCFGLDDLLARELKEALAGAQIDIRAEPFHEPEDCLRAADSAGADVIFCAAERQQYLALLEVVGRERPELPVVIVSHWPDVAGWLDAIEAGASDYCAAPFEPSHMRWILDSTVKHSRMPATYRAGG